jgi:sortase A
MKQLFILLLGWNPPGRRAKKRLFALYPIRMYASTSKGSVTIGIVLFFAGFGVVAQPIWELTVGNYIAIQNQSNKGDDIFTTPQIIAIGEGELDVENTITVEAKPALPNIDSGVLPGQIFSRIYIPRFGEDYERLIAHGTYANVLRNAMGHYDKTKLPGTRGNFAVAAHRTSYGASLFDIDKLKAGDRIIIETADKYYMYEHNNTVIVQPTDVNVLLDQPEFFLGDSKNLSILTLTSCHPKYSDAQRIIAFSVLKAVFDKNETSLDDVINSPEVFAPYVFPYVPTETVDNETVELVGEE